MNCDKPPDGWKCTREGGHDGPCAALPTGTPNGNPHATDAGNGQQGGFLTRLIDAILADPRTKDKICSAIRLLLSGLAIWTAGSSVNHLFVNASHYMDYIAIGAGAILTAAQFVWSFWKTDQHHDHVEILTSAVDAANIERLRGAMAEIKASTSPKGPTP